MVRNARQLMVATLVALLSLTLTPRRCEGFSLLVSTARIAMSARHLAPSAGATNSAAAVLDGVVGTVEREEEERSRSPRYVSDCPSKEETTEFKKGRRQLDVEPSERRRAHAGPFREVSKRVGSILGIDPERASELGVAFALSYSVVSNVNASISLSVAWYLSCVRTGLSPLLPGQWRSLLRSYGTIYAAVQLLRPVRIASAVALSGFFGDLLDRIQDCLNCSRGLAVLVQYSMGWAVWAGLAGSGIMVASWCSGVPVWR